MEANAGVLGGSAIPSINLCELVVGGGCVGAEDAGGAEVVGAG